MKCPHFHVTLQLSNYVTCILLVSEKGSHNSVRDMGTDRFEFKKHDFFRNFEVGTKSYFFSSKVGHMNSDLYFVSIR